MTGGRREPGFSVCTGHGFVKQMGLKKGTDYDFDSRRTGTGTRRRAGYKGGCGFGRRQDCRDISGGPGGAEGAPGFSTRERQYEQIIEAEGLAAAPGLVDVHVHFRDPGPTYKEDIHTGARAAAKGGFTTVVCMANTNPIVDNEETLRYVLEEGKRQASMC